MQTRPPDSSSVLEGAVIDCFVPIFTEPPFDEALAESVQEIASDAESLAPGISQRRLLLFDETLPVHIVLRLNSNSNNDDNKSDEDALKTLLKRLRVSLSASVVEDTTDAAAGAGPGGAPGVRDVVFNGNVDEHDDPLVVVNSFDDEEADGEREGEASDGRGTSRHLHLIWKIDVFLHRPRVRVQFPRLSLSASATLSSSSSGDKDADDLYLTSGVPASANILQSLSEAPGNDARDLFLPASRLSKAVPMQEPERRFSVHNSSSVQQPYKRIFRITPVTNARIRYSRGNYFSARPFLLASLDFEVAPSSPFEIVFESARLELLDGGGSVECLSDGFDFRPPITCRPRDDATLLYKLLPKEPADTARNETVPLLPPSMSVLQICLAASVLVPGLGYRPAVTMQWRTNVEFLSATEPAGSGANAMLQRERRGPRGSLPLPARPDTASASQRPGTAATGKSVGSTMTGLVRPATIGTVTATESTAVNNGVTISFTGPKDVIVGQEFEWDVFIVNRSSQSRKFALGSVLRRKHADARKNVARPSSSSGGGRKNDQIAETVSDSNVLYVMQKNAIPFNTDLISLSTDVRAGPLAPGACHQTKMRFLPLATGPLQIEAVRAIDLATNETFDIRHLPHIMARTKA